MLRSSISTGRSQVPADRHHVLLVTGGCVAPYTKPKFLINVEGQRVIQFHFVPCANSRVAYYWSTKRLAAISPCQTLTEYSQAASLGQKATFVTAIPWYSSI